MLDFKIVFGSKDVEALTLMRKLLLVPIEPPFRGFLIEVRVWKFFAEQLRQRTFARKRQRMTRRLVILMRETRVMHVAGSIWETLALG